MTIKKNSQTMTAGKKTVKYPDQDIELPTIGNASVNKERLMEYFDYFEIESLKMDLGVFE